MLFSLNWYKAYFSAEDPSQEDKNIACYHLSYMRSFSNNKKRNEYNELHSNYATFIYVCGTEILYVWNKENV